jgi:hypothetical protein
VLSCWSGSSPFFGVVLVIVVIPKSTRPTCPPRVICEVAGRLNIVKFLVLTVLAAVFLVAAGLAVSSDRSPDIPVSRWRPPRKPPS